MPRPFLLYYPAIPVHGWFQVKFVFTAEVSVPAGKFGWFNVYTVEEKQILYLGLLIVSCETDITQRWELRGFDGKEEYPLGKSYFKQEQAIPFSPHGAVPLPPGHTLRCYLWNYDTVDRIFLVSIIGVVISL